MCAKMLETGGGGGEIQKPWYVLSCLWDGAYKRTFAANRKDYFYFGLTVQIAPNFLH